MGHPNFNLNNFWDGQFLSRTLGIPKKTRVTVSSVPPPALMDSGNSIWSLRKLQVAEKTEICTQIHLHKCKKTSFFDVSKQHPKYNLEQKTVQKGETSSINIWPTIHDPMKTPSINFCQVANAINTMALFGMVEAQRCKESKSLKSKFLATSCPRHSQLSYPPRN